MRTVALRSSPLDVNDTVSPEMEKSGQSSLLRLLSGGPLISGVLELVSKRFGSWAHATASNNIDYLQDMWSDEQELNELFTIPTVAHRKY